MKSYGQRTEAKLVSPESKKSLLSSLECPPKKAKERTVFEDIKGYFSNVIGMKNVQIELEVNE